MNILFWEAQKTTAPKLASTTFDNLYQLCSVQSEINCSRSKKFSPDDHIDLVVMSSWNPVLCSCPILLCSPPLFSSKTKRLLWRGLSRLQSISLLYPYEVALNIPQFTFPPLLNNFRPSLPLGSEILSIGPLEKSSGHHLLIDAFSLLPARLRYRFKLHLIGKPTDRKYIDRLHLHSYNLPVFIHEQGATPLPQRQASCLHIFISPQKDLSAFTLIYDLRPTLCGVQSPYLNLYGDSAQIIRSFQAHDIAQQMKEHLEQNNKQQDRILEKRAKYFSSLVLGKKYLHLLQTLCHNN